MNQNEEDNNLNSSTESTETTEAIDSEIDESPVIEDLTNTKAPVVIKKGSFLSFVAFILSGSALTVSAYLYIQMKQAQENKSTDTSWQAPLAVIKKDNSEKFSQFSKQLAQLKKTNSTLQAQLQNIEDAVTKFQPVNNLASSTEKYDDTQIVNEIKEFDKSLSDYKAQLKQLQLKLSENNKHQNQVSKQLRNDIKNTKQLSANTTEPVKSVKSNHAFDATLSLLQEAHIQLNIRGNVKKAQGLLNKALVRIKNMSGAEYNKAAEGLQNIMAQINDNKPPELFIVSNQIETLSAVTKHLTFSQATATKENKKQQDSSWYDKLIVIRKVDDEKQTKLTTSEQQVIRGELQNRYDMLRVSLANSNQTTWNNEISAIETLLDLHFSESATSVKSKLSELKTINLNPDLPDLENYLNKFKDLENAHSKQTESD